MSLECDTESLSHTLPAGCEAVSLSSTIETLPLSLAILVRTDPKLPKPCLIQLRETQGARIFLGCICDQVSRVLQWVELWIQDNSSLSASSSCLRTVLSNAALDKRWQNTVEALDRLDPGEMIHTGFETRRPLPTLIHVSERTSVHLIDPRSGTPWQLCTDENLLGEKGLPSYGSSLYRYLYVPALGKDSKLAAITPDAPFNDSTVSLSDLCGGDLIRMNPGGGYLMVRKYHPLALEAFVELLSVGRMDMGHCQEASINPAQAIHTNCQTNSYPDNGFLFRDSSGCGGRLVEVLHIKLRFLADLAHSLRTMLHCVQRPFLNIDEITWRVRLGQGGRSLPFFWTATPILSVPPDSFPIEIEGSDIHYYLPSPFLAPSVYRPRIGVCPVLGRATLRIRKVLYHNKALTLEGTFISQQRMDIHANDMVRFELHLPSGRINLHAWLESNTAMATGEWRFRTPSCQLADIHVADLKAIEGIPQQEIAFEVLPLLSSPFDLYSLAVLAIRILFVDRTMTLPVALDAILSLAQELRAAHRNDTSLETRIAEVFAADRRWIESLGPGRLVRGELRQEHAIHIVPPSLWWRTLAVILKMVPGAGPDSVCSNLGDAPQGGLHKALDPVITELNDLTGLTRSMIVSEWDHNRAVRDILDGYRQSEH
jgi:hypothetical protein